MSDAGGPANVKDAIVMGVAVAVAGGVYLAYRSLWADRRDAVQEDVQQATDRAVESAQAQAQGEVEKRVAGQREKAIGVLNKLIDSKGRMTCAAVMAPGGQWFYDWFGELFSATVGDYFESIQDNLAKMPTDENLRTVMEGETSYFQSQGYFHPGGWVSADARMKVILQCRATWMKTLTREQLEEFEKAQAH